MSNPPAKNPRKPKDLEAIVQVQQVEAVELQVIPKTAVPVKKDFTEFEKFLAKTIVDANNVSQMNDGSTAEAIFKLHARVANLEKMLKQLVSQL